MAKGKKQAAAKKKAVANKAETPPADVPAVLDTRFGLPPFVPTDIRDRKYCEARVKGETQEQAALTAGFAPKTARHKAHEIEARNREYIDWLIAHQAQANAKQIAIELEPVLQEVAKIAFANEYDYLVFEASTDDPNKPPIVRRKRLDELTRDQMVAIKVIRRANGELDYVLRDKEGRLIDLVKHLGGFSEKIILEHRHRHLHAHIDLTKVPLEQLQAIEAEMAKLIRGRTRGDTLELE